MHSMSEARNVPPGEGRMGLWVWQNVIVMVQHVEVIIQVVLVSVCCRMGIAFGLICWGNVHARNWQVQEGRA